MQLGKKTKTRDMFERVRGELGNQIEDSAPLMPISSQAARVETQSSGLETDVADNGAIQIVINEHISARLSREGTLQACQIKGDLQLRISDASLTKVKLDLIANATHNAQFKTHPNVDKNFPTTRTIQLKDPSKGFPVNQSVGVLRWTATAPIQTNDAAPIIFTVWVNKGADTTYTFTIEYEAHGDDLRDVVFTIPYSTSEPAVSSFDAVYEVSGDTLEWTIGNVDESNASGSFEFEAEAVDEAEFFPMSVYFAKSKPYVDVDVSTILLPSCRLLMPMTQVVSVALIDMGETLPFVKDIKSVSDSYLVD